MKEQLSTPAAQPDPTTLSSGLPPWVAGALDSIFIALFCLSFSSLRHALSALWYAFSVKK